MLPDATTPLAMITSFGYSKSVSTNVIRTLEIMRKGQEVNYKY